MASGRKPTARNRNGNVDKDAARKNSAVPSLYLPNIALIALAKSLSVFRPIGCVATATDRHNCSPLVRRRGETLTQLLTRLDLAIAKAFTEDIFTDEINSPSNTS